MIGGEIGPCGCAECKAMDALAFRQRTQQTTKPTIRLRIRVGVTADGTYVAHGHGGPSIEITYTEQQIVCNDLDGCGPVVAWHWITAEVPMPETEQGETKGTVEHG